jgi:osmotically-inducible protein OsmY
MTEKTVWLIGACAFVVLLAVSISTRLATQSYQTSERKPLLTANLARPALARGDIIVPVTLRMKLAAGQVILLGAVPDVVSHQTILERTKKIYGAENVSDRLEVQSSVATTPWFDAVLKWFPPDLKRVRTGEITVSGTKVLLLGDVENHSTRVAAEQAVAAAAGPEVAVQNELKLLRSPGLAATVNGASPLPASVAKLKGQEK